MSDRYFELNDDVGVTADGNLEPLVRQGLTIAVPTMADGEVVDTAYSIVIESATGLADDEHARIIPNTRIIHSRDPRVSDGVLQTGSYHEVDHPDRKTVAKQKATTEDSREEAGTHSDADEEVNG